MFLSPERNHCEGSFLIEASLKKFSRELEQTTPWKVAYVGHHTCQELGLAVTVEPAGLQRYFTADLTDQSAYLVCLEHTDGRQLFAVLPRFSFGPQEIITLLSSIAPHKDDITMSQVTADWVILNDKLRFHGGKQLDNLHAQTFGKIWEDSRQNILEMHQCLDGYYPIMEAHQPSDIFRHGFHNLIKSRAWWEKKFAGKETAVSVVLEIVEQFNKRSRNNGKTDIADLAITTTVRRDGQRFVGMSFPDAHHLAGFEVIATGKYKAEVRYRGVLVAEYEIGAGRRKDTFEQLYPEMRGYSILKPDMSALNLLPVIAWEKHPDGSRCPEVSDFREDGHPLALLMAAVGSELGERDTKLTTEHPDNALLGLALLAAADKTVPALWKENKRMGLKGVDAHQEIGAAQVPILAMMRAQDILMRNATVVKIEELVASQETQS
jgi:hypothetical protein